MRYTMKVHQLSAFYGTQKVLSNLNFDLLENSCVGLIGPNGAGKTTLIKALLGLIEVRGKIEFHNQIIRDNGIENNNFKRIRRDIGYLPETSSFYQHLSPREYLTLIGNLLDYSTETTTQKVKELIKHLNLTNWSDRLISELSKGNLQRLSLATTFMQEPKLMLLDEPLSGLAPGGRKVLKDIIKDYTTVGVPMLKIEQPGTVLLSSHILGDLEELCNSFILMDISGSIVWKGSKYDIEKEENVESIEDLYLSFVKE